MRKSNSVGDHRHVFIRRCPKHFLDVQQPCLSINGNDGRLRLQQETHLVIISGGDILAAGRTERGQLRAPEFLAFGLVKKLDVLGIGPRPAALNVMDAERIKLRGNAQLIHHGKVDAFALTAVAQGRIVDFDVGFHNQFRRREPCPRRRNQLSTTLQPSLQTH